MVSHNLISSQVGEKLYVVFFLLAVFFVPFVVITSSYLVVTVRIWRFSSAHRRQYGTADRASSVRQTR